MSKRMLINAVDREETRVAVLDEKGLIENLIVETDAKGQIKGNIYKATVVNVDAGLEAAFIEYGSNRHGFLPLSDVQKKYFDCEGNFNPSRSHEFLKKGTSLLVQAEREEVMHKGAVFTTYLSLPGRFMVVMPESTGGGISRKIESERERKTLKETLKILKEGDENIAIIIRTAGVGHDDQALKSDYQSLVKEYKNILTTFKHKKGVGLLYEDLDMTIRSLRDYFSKDINEVVIDNYKVYKKAIEFFKRFMPEHLDAVKSYRDKRPLFAKYNVEQQIDQMYERMSPLPSGGSICIDPTEALISIDVNSGSAKSESGQETLAFQTNVEAAVEVARQLRIRNLGGLVVIDFIDMNHFKHRKIIEKIMLQATKKDKARIEISSIGKFGLMEMSRQRIKANFASISKNACTTCNGRGLLRATSVAGMAVVRKLTDLAVNTGSRGEIRIEAAIIVADHLLNEKRGAIQKIEHSNNISIKVTSNPMVLPGFENFAVMSKSVLEEESKRAHVAKDRKERSQTRSFQERIKKQSKSHWKYNDDGIEAKELPKPIQDLLNDHFYEITNKKSPTQPGKEEPTAVPATQDYNNRRRRTRKRPDRISEEKFQYARENFRIIDIEENKIVEKNEDTFATIEYIDKEMELLEQEKRRLEEIQAKQLEIKSIEDLAAIEKIKNKDPNTEIKSGDTIETENINEDSNVINVELNDAEVNQVETNSFNTIDIDSKKSSPKKKVEDASKDKKAVSDTLKPKVEEPNVQFISLSGSARNFGAGLIDSRTETEDNISFKAESIKLDGANSTTLEIIEDVKTKDVEKKKEISDKFDEVSEKKDKEFTTKSNDEKA
ncbi:MAG: hypothetical protein COA79_07500 [Planctomycetota bacterium]|nr:MAG: hypothetical protein COA79_07500 [Planctomycetota bacterium]